MSHLTFPNSVQFLGRILAPYENLSSLLGRSEKSLLSEREDDFWQGLSEEIVFSGLSPEDLKAQANFLIGKLQKLSTKKTPLQPIPPTVLFTARQNCVLFCRVYGIHFSESAPPPIPIFAPPTIPIVDTEATYSELRKFGAQFFMIPISLEGITIMTLQAIYEMYISEIFYDSKTETRWEKVAEKLSDKRLKWTPDASEVEAIYKTYTESYKYDYLPNEDQEPQGTISGDSTNDSNTTFERIALYLAAIFGSKKDLRYLLERDLAAWKPAFHRVDKYWEQLSENRILQGHSWESVKNQTVFLLGKVEELCTSKIPYFNGYKADLQHDFTYEQNMYLIRKALKLGVLVPFMKVKLNDIVSKLSGSSIFGEHVSETSVVMLGLGIKRLIYYLEPSLSASYRETLDDIRELQAKYRSSMSEVWFLEPGGKMLLVYYKAMKCYKEQLGEDDKRQLGESDEESGEEQLCEGDNEESDNEKQRRERRRRALLGESNEEQLEESDDEEQWRKQRQKALLGESLTADRTSLKRHSHENLHGPNKREKWENSGYELRIKKA